LASAFISLNVLWPRDLGARAVSVSPHGRPRHQAVSHAYQRTLRLPTDGTTVSAERTLGQFQRWAVRRIYTACRFEDYDPAIRLAA
jgi:hypothetical protein